MASAFRKRAFSLLKQVARPFSGRGISNLPLVWPAYFHLYKIFNPGGLGLFNVQGVKMYADYSQRSTTALMFDTYEPGTTELFKKSVDKGMTVVDIGANIGYYTLIAANLVGETGTVYSFEPESKNFSILQKNIELNGFSNVISVQKAISDVSGRAELFLSDESFAQHSLIVSDDREPVLIDTIMLDEYFNDNVKIGVIKIDVEGAEPLVLQGMDAVIKGNKDLKLFIEFSPSRIHKTGLSPQDFLNKLEYYGFDIFKILENKKAMVSVSHDDFGELCEISRINLFCKK